MEWAKKARQGDGEYMSHYFLYLANLGIDVIRIDAVPYIWKELNTQCRNLKRKSIS